MAIAPINMQLLFDKEVVMPTALFHCFKACNQAPRTWVHKQAFYQFKNEYLQKHATFNDYDLQRVEIKCTSCDGKGNYSRYVWAMDDYYHDKCWHCNKGVYAVYYVALKRWILNGHLFHQPMGRVNENGVPLLHRSGYYEDRAHGNLCDTLPVGGGAVEGALWYTPSIIYRTKITGYITHPPSKVNPNFPYMVLMYKYNRTEFNRVVQYESKLAQTRAKNRLNDLLRKSNSTLRAFAGYFEISETDIEKYVDEMEIKY